MISSVFLHLSGRRAVIVLLALALFASFVIVPAQPAAAYHAVGKGRPGVVAPIQVTASHYNACAGVPYDC